MISFTGMIIATVTGTALGIHQIYPLGFCGAPFENDGILEHRILKVNEWIPHIKKLGMNAIYFSPVFESDTHGYNTRDYTKIDCRLGTNDDFRQVVENCHKAGIKVIIDGVFNHVGRGFWAFQDVLEKRWDSPYKDWFHISFDGNSNYNDGLWYEGWEGNYDLVKLNLRNPAVADHIMDCVMLYEDAFPKAGGNKSVRERLFKSVIGIALCRMSASPTQQLAFLRIYASSSAARSSIVRTAATASGSVCQISYSLIPGIPIKTSGLR